MKSSDVIKIILLGICALFLTGIFVLLLFNNNSFFKFTFKNNSKELYNEEYKMSDISEIKVNVLSTDVIIEKSDIDTIKVIINGDEDNKEKYSIENSNGIIEIKEKVKRVIHIGFYWFDENITIYVPYDYDKKVNITTASGDLDINDDFNFELKAKLISGDIEARTLSDVDVETTSGDISITKIKNGNLKSVSGDIEIDSSDNIDIQTTSGDIKIGSVNISKNCKIKSTSGDVRINKTNDIYIETKTVSGSEKIKENNRHAEYDLTIETISGDINIG